MKKIGKEVLFLKTGKDNFRNGEVSMLRAKDGAIILAYTEFVGDGNADHVEARITTIRSYDEGETWTSPKVLLTKPADAQNIMSPSLFRMKNGAVGMIYCRKDVLAGGGMICMPQFICSFDECETWSEPRGCGFPAGYYCSVNGGVTVTQSGRIYVPTSYTGAVRDAMRVMKNPPIPHVSDIRIAYSDDNGESWQTVDTVLSTPYGGKHGLYEPGIFEHEDGRLWLYMRTPFGHQYQSFSDDGGKSWSTPAPNFRFTSPDAPMRVARVKDYVVAVFNPLGYNCLFPKTETWKSPKRTPLALAVSSDDGKSFDERDVSCDHGGLLGFAERVYLLEDDLNESYCYPAIFPVEGGLLVAYYHSNGTPHCLNSTKVIKIQYTEFEQKGE